tara:strand:+ start:1517 stop:1981 length:465 start_codon:yes stop_codon:yes gene_type:complete
MEEYNPYIFVYGTLKSNQKNHSFLKGADYIGHYITNRKFNLLKGKTGLSYAVQVDNQSDPNADYLHGELYKINAGHFNSLDRLEGHPHHYERILTPIHNHGYAWIYVLGRYTTIKRDNHDQTDNTFYTKWLLVLFLLLISSVSGIIILNEIKTT